MSQLLYHVDDQERKEHKDNDIERQTTEESSQDKGSLNAFRSFLNGYNVFSEEKLMDDTYRHARPYNLTLMSTKTLWFVYLLFYSVLIASTIWSFTENYFTSDTLTIPLPNFIFLSDNSSLVSHGYDPANDVFNSKPYNDGTINKSIANIYFHNDSFYPYQEYIYLYGRFELHSHINASDPFIESLLNGNYLFNYTVLLNITNNDEVLGYESKYMENVNWWKNKPCSIPDQRHRNSENEVRCDQFSIWSPYDSNGFSASWQNTILKHYTKHPNPAMRFNTSVIFYNFDLYSIGNFTLNYVFTDSDFVQVEFYAKCALCGLTMVFLILWVWYGLSDSKTQKDLIAEQRWMIVLFFAALLYQNPLTIGLFANDPTTYDAMYLISSLFFATAIHLFMIYWSLMIDSIREIKNLIDVTFEGVTKIGRVTFGCRFYQGKLMAIFISYSSAIVFTCCSQFMIDNNSQNQSYNQYFLDRRDSSLVITVLLSGIIWFFCVICFCIWLFKSLWNANKELNKLPYIETRERQLSLRYFKHHTFLVIIYVICIQIYSVAHYGSPLYLVDTRRTNLSTLIAVSVYVYMVAFMYLPMTNKLIKRNQHHFQLSNAQLLCHIAWQSYMSPLQMPDSPPIDTKWGIINLEYFNLELIEFVNNQKHDMQIIISKGQIHSKFKQQRSEMNLELRRGSRTYQKQLLLGPNPKSPSSHASIYQYRQSLFNDVSSDYSSSSSSAHESEEEQQTDSTSDRKEEEKEETNSILSFAAIKHLLNIHNNDRSFSLFNNKYGSIKSDEDCDENSEKKKQNALSLFSRKNISQSWKSRKQPLLASHNEDKTSSLLTTSSKKDTAQPISIHNNDSGNNNNESIVHYSFHEYPMENNEENNDYSAPNMAENQPIKNESDHDEIESVVITGSPSEVTQKNLNLYPDHSFENESENRKKRAHTLSSHKFNLRKSAKKKRNRNVNNENVGFRIPLLSNLLPNINNEHSLMNPFRINKIKSKKQKYVDIILGFRGTDSSVNVKLDLKFSRIAIDPLFWYCYDFSPEIINSEKWKKCVRKCIVNVNKTNNSNRNPLNIPSMKIHGGFYQSFADIREQLLQTILNTYYEIVSNKKHKKKIPRFFITGHSLGGALAQLCGFWLEILFGHKSPIHIYVYGCPRVGDRQFSTVVSGRIKHIYRVVFRGDIVTTLPRGFKKYKHAGIEIIIDNHGNMINAPSKREKALLPSRASLKDHSLTKYINSLNSIAKKHKLQHLILNVPKN